MATVYLAEDLKHGRRVAIKVLSPEVASEIGDDRFRREITIAARLTHPHILPLHDSGVVEGRLYYVMPFVQGETLRALIEREKRLPVEDAVRLAREIASALGYAHRQGLVHRDIKPDNILLADGMALVADFGIARATGSEAAMGRTAHGAILGTPSYMAPEQLVAGAAVDGRTDLYSLGCVTFEMLAGAPPFTGATESLALQHLSTAPPSLTDLRPETPVELAAVVARALAKAPADRYPTAAAFAEAVSMASLVAGASAPRVSEGATHHLPLERTRFIGREQDLAECSRLLMEHRLLTVTGVGGGGKTRLAIKLAERQAARFQDGVWFADLAPLGESRHVVEAVAQSLGVAEQAGKSLEATLVEHLGARSLLIVLDNCEHLLEACVRLADALLRQCPGVRILATSREPLATYGERVFALRSMSLPSPGVAQDAVADYEAVRLFVDRARLAVPDFSLATGNVEALVEICRRLDGIPLAIELAAARVKILSLEQIRSRLDDRFRLLTGGARGALPRHQTLRATLQWSYDQLGPEEQRLLRALSVFAGGWTLAAATAVADATDEFEVLELLGRLVDKSLVIVERAPGSEPRSMLLETVRQFVSALLVEEGETDAVRLRHLSFFAGLVERAYPERLTREESWGQVLEREHDNLRAALELARERQPGRYLELAGGLGWFWQARSHAMEGREHLGKALAATPIDPVRASRARASRELAKILTWQGEAREARRLMEEALESWRTLGDRREIALALEGIGWAQLLGAEDEAARASFEECLRLQIEIGDPVMINRARVALTQVLVALHHLEFADAMSHEILAYARASADRRSEHFGWHYLADCALIAGRCEESLALYGQSLNLAEAIGDRLETGFEIQGIAMSLAGLGEAALGVRLGAAVQAENARLGVDPHMRFWDELLERYLGAARAALGPLRAAHAEEDGRAMSFERAIATAREASRSSDLSATVAIDPNPGNRAG